MLARARDPQAPAYSRAICEDGVKPRLHFTLRDSLLVRLIPDRSYEWTEQSDSVKPFHFMAFAFPAVGLLHFDVMLEAKARDHAALERWE